MAYDFSGFHTGCLGVYCVPSAGSVLVVCPDCKVAADIEAISAKVSSADACKTGKIERTVLGKQSPNVNKGGFVQ